MKTSKARILAIAGLVILSGCAGTGTPDLDARFGESANMLKAQQTLNPDASRNMDPVAGLDGKAAKGALDNYRDSFRKPPSEALTPLISNNVSTD
ncbi:hypothetical protein [Propionivibrio limicola]|uniref:hypothetical protein n=1 Tax=Propionivibrio limicola TaxID=167645 RepID=UPI0012920C19|nr:hypothetical protein [Propionivibrio limicola]